MAQTNRTVHVALSAEGSTHPDAIPALAGALRAEIRSNGLRVDSGDDADELDVVLTGSEEIPSVPQGTAAEGFEPAAWDGRLRTRATLRESDGTLQDLGSFESSSVEPAGSTAPSDDSAQAAAVESAARMIAERIVAAMLAAMSDGR